MLLKTGLKYENENHWFLGFLWSCFQPLCLWASRLTTWKLVSLFAASAAAQNSVWVLHTTTLTTAQRHWGQGTLVIPNGASHVIYCVALHLTSPTLWQAAVQSQVPKSVLSQISFYYYQPPFLKETKLVSSKRSHNRQQDRQCTYSIYISG